MANSIVRELAQFIDRDAVDDFLHDLGLERRSTSSVISGLGLFTVGVIVGAAISLLLSPKPGVELRNDIAQRMQSLREDVESRVQSATKKGERYNPPS